MLSHDALEIQLAHPLKQRDTAAVNVIDVAEWTIQRRPCEQPAEFLLALYQLMGSQILAIKRQEVECEEAWRSAMEQEIVEGSLPHSTATKPCSRWFIVLASTAARLRQTQQDWSRRARRTTGGFGFSRKRKKRG